MKRSVISVLTFLYGFISAGFFCVYAADYMPPAGGDRLFLYGHPKFVTGANSAAGGPLFSEGSYSIYMNPALTAGLQCLSADLGYTGLVQTADNDSGYNQALHLGASIPTRSGVFTGGIHAIFAESVQVNYGNIAAFKFGWARDVTEHLYLGFSMMGGILSYDGGDSDFLVSGDIGGWYRLPELLFLKKVRFGLALQNIGKSFWTSGPVKYSNAIGFPGIITPKASVAASLVEVQNFAMGLSVDVAFPTFVNVLLNTGLQVAVMDVVYISAGWDLNVREMVVEDYKPAVHGPYLGIGVKFSVNTSNNELMKKRGFNETVIETDGVWQKLHQDVHLFSIGATASFGVKDVIPPDISVGEVRAE